ncbi:MAG: tRNA (5-methylaminomethyl-2-thiouridine)(34)-methyltransferase MnmD [Muribaculaceae bacterium]|nr:tRNA (5-methylaminomethyl-2-thiouridine)(34)-methyltransferase MnmD [Muribaculaceae bacterium]
MKLEVEKTADGSPTLYCEDIDEHYHSVKGALVESRHVYVDLGWRKAAQHFAPITVFEVGFGTGLNAALTAKAALDSGKKTVYHSVELYPLPKETIDLLIPFQSGEYRSEFQAVNDASWGESIEINPFFTLIKIQANLLEMSLPENITAVYFDAFAPEKQPEMWKEEIFRKIFASMPSGGILTTYCAKGSIRRMLQAIGFLTERLPGPPGGKREVLRATAHKLVTIP